MKKHFAAFLLAVTAFGFSACAQIVIMIEGWGLEPKSWLAIIGLGLLSTLITQVFVECAKSLEKD